MTRFRTTGSLLGMAAVLLLAGSCVESKHPLSDEKTSKIDERLIGRWKIESDQGEWAVQKSTKVPNAIEIDVPGPDAGRVLGFVTTVKDKGYISTRDADIKKRDEKTPQPDKTDSTGYEIYQYVFLTADRVQCRGMVPEVIVKAIENKTLTGEARIKKTTTRTLFGKETVKEEKVPVITATPAELKKYLEAHADECFPVKQEDPQIWVRQK